MMTDTQNELIRQFNHLAPRAVEFEGRKYSRRPSSIILIGKTENAHFQFRAKLRRDEFFPATLGVEVTYIPGRDTYDIEIRHAEGTNFRTLGKLEDIYFDQFEDLEGLVRCAARKAGDVPA